MQIQGYEIEQWIAALVTVLALYGSVAWGVFLSIVGRDTSQAIVFVLTIIGLAWTVAKALRMVMWIAVSGVALVALGHVLPALATIVKGVA